MLFRDLIGQDAVRQKLVEMVTQDRLSHAILLVAPEGAGGLPLASALAQYLVCEKRALPAGPSLFGDAEPAPAMPDACGQCSACRRAQQLQHPDIHFSFPVIPKKPGDKPVSADFMPEWREFFGQYPYASVYDWLQFINAENRQGNITAAECSDILRKLSLKSFEGGYKVLVQWMPEYLGNEGNKLLKIIEEPPPDTLFVLVTENESLLLPTLLSRMQVIRVPRLRTEELEEALVTRNGTPREQAHRIAALSEGNYREARQLLNHADDDWLGLLRDWLNTIVKTGPVAQVKWIEDMAKLGRERQKQFLQYFLHVLEQALRASVQDGFPAGLPEKERDFTERLGRIAGPAAQEAIARELDNAIYYIERNAHAKLLFHALTIKLYHIIAAKESVILS